jgi:uncharacterized iron-regulated membrane protein
MGFVRHLHRTLLIPEAGKYIVGLSSLVLVVLIITGLRLWIPKRWSNLKARLGVKKGASFKRKNYDWHNSLGFYFSPFIALIALTGAAITFNKFIILALFIVGFEEPQTVESLLGQHSEYRSNTPPLAIDSVVALGNAAVPGGIVEGISLPYDSVGTYGVNITAPGPAETGDRSLLYYDQYSGQRVMSTHHDLAHIGKLYLNWVTPMHYGTFGGLPTRLVALVSSLIVPILFVTGFIIWWGRWKKRKKITSSAETQPQKELQNA